MLEEENLSSHNSKLHLLWGAWKCWYWWCTVCMVKSCSSMICWQPSGFSMHMSLCHVCLVDSSGVLERAILQGLWTHLSGLVMKKKPTPGAQQVVSCIVFRGSSQLRKLGNISSLEIWPEFLDLILEWPSSSKYLDWPCPHCFTSARLTHSNKSPQCTATHVLI